MDYSFPNFPQGVVFNNAVAPGDVAFASAWKYWANQAKEAAQGKGLPQLAAAKTADQSGQQYQTSPYAGPTTGGNAQQAGLAAKGGNLVGQASSRSAKQKTSNDVTSTSLSGGLDAANAYGTSLQNQLEGNIALNKAQASQTANNIGGITGFMNSLFGGPFGQAGLQTLLGGGGMGSFSPFSMLGMGSGGSLPGGPFDMSDLSAFIDPSTLASLGLA